jgi:hypothetical protein
MFTSNRTTGNKKIAWPQLMLRLLLVGFATWGMLILGLCALYTFQLLHPNCLQSISMLQGFSSISPTTSDGYTLPRQVIFNDW